MIRDINTRYLRARFPDYAPEQGRVRCSTTSSRRAARTRAFRSDLLRTPDQRFFRRKGDARVRR